MLKISWCFFLSDCRAEDFFDVGFSKVLLKWDNWWWRHRNKKREILIENWWKFVWNWRLDLKYFEKFCLNFILGGGGSHEISENSVCGGLRDKWIIVRFSGVEIFCGIFQFAKTQSPVKPISFCHEITTNPFFHSSCPVNLQHQDKGIRAKHSPFVH